MCIHICMYILIYIYIYIYVCIGPGTITTATVICRIANGTVRNFCGRKRERQSGERRDKREGRQGRDHVKEEQERKHENIIHVD